MDHFAAGCAGVLLTSLQLDRRRRRVLGRAAGRHGRVTQRRPRRRRTPRHLAHLLAERRAADAEQEEVDGVVGDAERLGDLACGEDEREAHRAVLVVRRPPVTAPVVDLVEDHVGQLEADGRDADGHQHDGQLALGRLALVLRRLLAQRHRVTAASRRLRTDIAILKHAEKRRGRSG